MSHQPTEQSVSPRRPRSRRHGAISPATPSCVLVLDERALPTGVTPARLTQPTAEQVTSAPGARRVSMVENVAIQIFSGAIEFAASERNALVTSHGAGQCRWPLMLNRAEVCEYLGASWRTLKNVLTVRPVDMGANMIRYNREELKTWAASRPPKGLVQVGHDKPHTDQDAPDDTTAAALARARDRGCKR